MLEATVAYRLAPNCEIDTSNRRTLASTSQCLRGFLPICRTPCLLSRPDSKAEHSSKGGSR